MRCRCGSARAGSCCEQPCRTHYAFWSLAPAAGSGCARADRDLTADEHARYDQYGYVKFEQYPEGAGALGCYWTQPRLDGVGKGCGTVTKMGLALCETYARDPTFYGATFCCDCRKHLPVEEFRWVEDGEVVGS